MYILENPVMQRELLVNLRMARGFILLLVYQCLLGLVVYFAWPQDTRLDLSVNSASTQQTRELVDMFFIGQFVVTSMMAPSFAAGSITGEKERKTYEMLLASPLRPPAIVLGKLVASLAYLAVLVFSSLPIVMLCLPLGGVHPSELAAAYLGLMLSVVTFGMISVACSAYFQRTSASLVVSYLLILIPALLGVLYWKSLADFAQLRLFLLVPIAAVSIALCIGLFVNTSVLLLHPPDVGSEGKEVVDLEQESQQAVGLVIQRDQFPDKLFAPPKRDDLMEDNANPVYDKEIRSEIFSQGTLMLRLVIQVSMVLAIPFMAVCLYIYPALAAWYICYVVVFNMLVGPVFSAGSVTSERERETLDLLLTTTISPWHILWGKLVAGLRVSSVLTLFLVWPVLLACVMVSLYWSNLLAVIAYLSIVLITCLTTAMVALFCSVMAKKSSIAMMSAYLVIIVMFCAPLAIGFFAETFYREHPLTRAVAELSFSSPFSVARSIPLDVGNLTDTAVVPKNWILYLCYLLFSVLLNAGLLLTMTWLFRTRWRVAGLGN